MQATTMTPETYPHKNAPWNHQRDTLADSWEEEFYAILWEQGTGKTKVTIDNACLLYMNGRINGMLVVAPPGVHANWETDEFPEHLPAILQHDTMILTYRTKQAKNKSFAKKAEQLLAHKGLAVLLMSYANFMTAAGKALAKKFLQQRHVFYVLDEASAIKNPGAKRTKTIRASGRLAPFKRILEGTPVSNSPFDIYAPFCFMKHHFWFQHDCEDFSAFTQRFGIWKRMKVQDGHEFNKCVAYKDLARLQEIIKEHSSRVLADDVQDLPPQLYTKRHFEMTKEQWRVYNELKNDKSAMLGKVEQCPDCEGTGKIETEEWIETCEACRGRGRVSDLNMTTELPMVRMLRYQQVACGYSPVDEDPNLRDLEGGNPRLECLMEEVAQTQGKFIVWSRFERDITKIMERFEKDGIKAVRYDGQVDELQCEENKRMFQKVSMADGGPQAFVANPSKGARGLTLHAAKKVIYYSNSFKLIDRLQSEKRAHRGGMDEHPVLYVDILSDAPVDMNVVKALRAKVDVSNQVTGDTVKDWI